MREPQLRLLYLRKIIHREPGSHLAERQISFYTRQCRSSLFSALAATYRVLSGSLSSSTPHINDPRMPPRLPLPQNPPMMRTFDNVSAVTQTAMIVWVTHINLFSKRVHVFGFDLDPVVFTAMQGIYRFQVLDDQTFASAPPLVSPCAADALKYLTACPESRLASL